MTIAIGVLVVAISLALVVHRRSPTAQERMHDEHLDAAESGITTPAPNHDHAGQRKGPCTYLRYICIAVFVLFVLVCAFLASAHGTLELFSATISRPVSAGHPPFGLELIEAYGSLPVTRWLDQEELLPESRALFNQGLAQLYNFNQIEARRSFESALFVDDRCLMCHWGIAHSYGSTVNGPMSEEDCWRGLHSIDSIQGSVSSLPSLQRLLVAAQRERYSCCNATGGAWEDRIYQCEKSYASAMSLAIKNNPHDPHVLCQFADTQLNLIPWDYYHGSNDAKILKPIAQRALSAVLDGLFIDPQHILCLHLAIHIYEPSNTPQDGEFAADALARAVQRTQLGHLLHMPSHIYARIGRYEDSIACNERAISSNNMYTSRRLAPYVPDHNQAMLVASAMAAAQVQPALKYSKSCFHSDPMSGYSLTSSFPAQKELVLCRFGMWQDIQALRQQEQRTIGFNKTSPLFLQAITNYAGALAAIHLNKGHAIGALRDDLQRNIEGLTANKVDAPFTKGSPFYGNHVEMARLMLLIVNAAERVQAKDLRGATQHLVEAVRIQDDFLYTEPDHFYLPIRQCLGAVYLMRHQQEHVNSNTSVPFVHLSYSTFVLDLKVNPGNSWSSTGLMFVRAASHNNTINTSIDHVLAPYNISSSDLGVCHEIGFRQT